MPRGASKRRHEARSSARNGLRASSAPSVVGGPWPGVDDGLGREALGEHADRLDERVPVAPGRSVRPTEPAKRTSPEKSAAVGVVGEVRRRVAGDAQRLERDAGELERLVALEKRVAAYAAGDDARRREVGEVLEQRALALGHVDRCAGALGEVGDAAEVVPVPVRDQDRGAASAERARARAEARRRRRRDRRRRPPSASCEARTT